MYYQQEAQTWQEMMETLQEVQQLQELQTPANETGSNIHRGKVVVIRIQLMPSNSPIFGHPKRIVGSLNTTNGPLTGKTIVPVREVNTLTGEVSNGLVYAPNVGSNEFEFSFLGSGALQKAGGWLSRQLTRMPKLAQRIQSIKALVPGKPCPGCERQFGQKLGKLLPRNVKFQFNRDPNGQWNAGLNFQNRQGQDVSIAGNGQGNVWNANLQGIGPNGQQYGANASNNNGQWGFNGNYQDANGNYVTANGQGMPGQWDASADGTIAGNNFGANAGADGQGYNGYGYVQNNGGQNLYGGAFAGGPNHFQGAAVAQNSHLNANASGNWQQEMESSILGEVFREIGL